MILIAHRGNTNGRIVERENQPSYILEALEKGYDVEIDVWLIGDQLYLGHDAPQYLTEIEFLRDERLWCHAKNVEALVCLLENDCHVFSHDKDPYILTSRGYIWAYPGMAINSQTVCVLPEAANYKEDEVKGALGICSDFVAFYAHEVL
jgi:hypothetical protein